MRMVKLFVPLTCFGFGVFHIDLQGFIQISDVSYRFSNVSFSPGITGRALGTAAAIKRTLSNAIPRHLSPLRPLHWLSRDQNGNLNYAL